jgi:4-aminobutyrate aminotransferase-like enzyme
LQSLTKYPFVDNVRGKGLLCGLEIVADKESREPDAALAGKLAGQCMANGLRTRAVAGNTFAFSPPLTINADEVDWMVETLDGVFEASH